MKNFLTKNEACGALKKMTPARIVTQKDSVYLASIRVCIAAEELGYNLWGHAVEDARPLFRDCEIPNENSSEDVVANYEAYQLCLSNAQELFKENKEG